MDLEKTSFSVDWFTPGEKYTPKRLSFPKSARISIDDLVSDSPLGFCFDPVDDAIPRPRSCSIVDTPYERAFGWTNSAPPLPFVPSDHQRCPMYDQDPKLCEETPTGWRALASPGLLSVADDFALCGVELDVSCLDSLDEQLLLSPLESFTELCWAGAVHDEVTSTPAVSRRNTRSRARSFKYDRERAFPTPLTKDYPGSFECTRPLSAKITLLPETFPHYLSYPCEAPDASLTDLEKSFEYILYNDSEEHRAALPAQGLYNPWRSTKRDLTLTPSFELPAQPQPSKACLQPPKPSHTLRFISDACLTLGRARRTSRH